MDGEKKMEEAKVKEVSEKEINLNFLIKSVKVIISDRLGRPDEYSKLYVGIKEPKILSQGGINYDLVPIPELSVENILKNIKKLYSVYTSTQNEKVEEGLREEILKLIALLVYRLG